MEMSKLLPHLIRLKGQANVTVEGTSMEPYLFAGDVVTVEADDDYITGDILVFYYKEEKLLIHRLLDEVGGRYFCKGDNALRVEDVTGDQIVGKVTLVNGEPPESWFYWKIDLSRRVGKEFHRCRYDAAATKESKIYRLYQSLVLKRKDLAIMYQKNNDFTYIFTDETSLAIFDPESGDTHLLDEVGISILNNLNDPIGLEELLENLCKEYAATPEEIRGDVEEFLAEMVHKGIVELV